MNSSYGSLSSRYSSSDNTMKVAAIGLFGLVIVVICVLIYAPSMKSRMVKPGLYGMTTLQLNEYLRTHNGKYPPANITR